VTHGGWWLASGPVEVRSLKFPIHSDETDGTFGLKPPQFGLRTMLVVTTIIALVFFTWRVFGSLAAATEVLFLLAILAHVAGNAVGTQLRDQRPRRDVHAAPDGGRHPPLSAQAFAPKSHLALRQRLGWMVPVIACLSGIAGGAMGGGWLIRMNAHQIDAGSMLLAYASCGVLGGIAGFLLYGFARVTFQAVREAHRHGK
jgi:hypothetical protein